MLNPWQRAWEQTSIYLPIVLMALLALCTWWLVRQAPQPLLPDHQTSVSAAPDYIMENVSMHQFDSQSRLQNVITGEQARHLPLTDTFEIDTVKTYSIGTDGTVAITRANRGISNSDSSEIQLLGDVKVVQKKPSETVSSRITGDFLHVWPIEERMQSHLPVEITKGSNQFKGDRIAYDNLSQVLELKGNVKGTLYPPTAPQ